MRIFAASFLGFILGLFAYWSMHVLAVWLLGSQALGARALLRLVSTVDTCVARVGILLLGLGTRSTKRAVRLTYREAKLI